MKQQLVIAALLGSLAAWGSPAESAGTVIGNVRLTRNATADGKPLPVGTYQVRLTGDAPAPAAGQAPDAEKWIEFVKGGTVVGREVATFVPDSEIGPIAKSDPRPAKNGSRVDVLKGGDYVRVWINRDGNNYLINLAARG